MSFVLSDHSDGLMIPVKCNSDGAPNYEIEDYILS